MTDTSSLNDEIRALGAEADEDRFASPKEARKKAMDYLARREYGQGELKQKLQKAGFQRGAVEQAVDQLTAEGLQDDRRFAEGFVTGRANRGKGPRHIQAELSQRGLDAGLINEALEEAGIDWREQAREVRRKKFGTAAPENFKEKARQMRFLQYRGFGPAEIAAAVGELDD